MLVCFVLKHRPTVMCLKFGDRKRHFDKYVHNDKIFNTVLENNFDVYVYVFFFFLNTNIPIANVVWQPSKKDMNYIAVSDIPVLIKHLRMSRSLCISAVTFTSDSLNHCLIAIKLSYNLYMCVRPRDPDQINITFRSSDS